MRIRDGLRDIRNIIFQSRIREQAFYLRYSRFTITLAWFDFKLFFDTFLNIFDSLPNREFDFIKTTCGATIYHFDPISAIVFTFRPSHLISYEFNLASYEYDFTSCHLVLTSYEFELASY